MGGANNTHSLSTNKQARVYTHVHNFIHRLIHSPRSQRDTKPHTSRNAYKYLAVGRPRHIPGHRGGCLAWGGCRSVCWRGCVRLDHDLRPPPPHWITLGNRQESAECIGRDVSPTLRVWLRSASVCGNGESRPGGWPALCVRLGGRCAGGALLGYRVGMMIIWAVPCGVLVV